MKSKCRIAIIALAVCSLICSCSHTLKNKKNSLTNIQWVNDSIKISSDKLNPQFISILVLDEVIYRSSYKKTWEGDVLSLIKKNSNKKLDIALYATRNNNHIPVNVIISDVIDTSFSMKLLPIEETSSISVIKGNCAPLVLSSTSPDYIREVRRWLFRKNEYLPDTLLNNMIKIAQELNKTGYNDFVTSENIPVLQSFSGTQYKVLSDMKADYYFLYACSSQQEINDRVEYVVTNNFEHTSTSLNLPLTCYGKSDSGYKCIMLIGLNKDWSYQQQPLGLVAIDNIVIGNQDFDISQILFNNNTRINIPSNKPNLMGYADIQITNAGGNGVACNVSFLIKFGGDIKSITIRRTHELCSYFRLIGYDEATPGPKDFIINTEKNTSPYKFSAKFHFEEGENFIPYIIEDYHGNKKEGKIVYRAAFTYPNEPQINIDNNINIDIYS